MDNQTNSTIYRNKNNFNTPHACNRVKIKFKSSCFLPIKLFLFVFTLLPVQYHNESLSIQFKKIQDLCSESSGFLNETHSYILDVILPHGFVKAFSIQTLASHFNDEKNADYNLNNLTLIYLNKSECALKNLTNLLNFISISPKFDRYIDLSPQNLNIFQIKQKIFLKTENSNVILVCDDDNFKVEKDKLSMRAELGDKIDIRSKFDEFESGLNIFTEVISRIFILFFH